MTAFDLAKMLHEARIRYAWGAHADVILLREAWPAHDQHPDLYESHHLALAEARALLKGYTVSPRD